MWRIVEHKYKPEVYRSGHTYQHNKLTEKSLEQDDMNAEQDGDLHMFRVGCPQLDLDTQRAHLLAPGHTVPSSSCWHKCSHTHRANLGSPGCQQQPQIPSLWSHS